MGKRKHHVRELYQVLECHAHGTKTKFNRSYCANECTHNKHNKVLKNLLCCWYFFSAVPISQYDGMVWHKSTIFLGSYNVKSKILVVKGYFTCSNAKQQPNWQYDWEILLLRQMVAQNNKKKIKKNKSKRKAFTKRKCCWKKL